MRRRRRERSSPSGELAGRGWSKSCLPGRPTADRKKSSRSAESPPPRSSGNPVCSAHRLLEMPSDTGIWYSTSRRHEPPVAFPLPVQWDPPRAISCNTPRRTSPDTTRRRFHACQTIPKRSVGSTRRPSRCRTPDHRRTQPVPSTATPRSKQAVQRSGQALAVRPDGGGRRCPSEHLALAWEDVDWEHDRMTIHSPKTKRYEGKESRGIPIFPELRTFLEAVFNEREAALGRPPSATDRVITGY